ncbi:peroxide stress protein YaaA [uncultured Tissierella sp.]|uniref:peroxide stress protein YaaA n=1 Tax=uncultured Tissierella sp. TaxID=448160 RepID=UPI002805EC5C|nr:peroxide stress protein YaaA [uncultured Tissierella sp.]
MEYVTILNCKNMKHPMEERKNNCGEEEAMRIIISPAKKMRIDSDDLGHRHIPEFIKDAEILLTYLQGLNYKEVKSIWKCNDKIAMLNYERIRNMDLHRNLTPAILSYEGIQYQYMAPGVFEEGELEYIDEHLRILSGFYGILRPFDGVVPYRLEMQAKLIDWHFNSLYQFWNDKLAKKLFSQSKCIVNLASKEYSKCIFNYLDEGMKFITCVFGELINGKVVEKGTFAKMARGEMVRFMAEKRIKNVEEIKDFDRLGYIFKHELSNENTYVFIKNNNEG